MYIFASTKCRIMSKEVKMRIGRNIRYLRANKKISIEKLADELGISTSGLYSFEAGRTEPDGTMLVAISKIFGVTVDALLLGDFAKTDPASLMKIGNNKVLFPITVDNEGRENIQVVNIKAKAGYTAGYNDPEFISGLPSFQLPFLSKERTYRAFQIEGDSMNPIKHGSYVIGEYVPHLNDIKDGNAYILLTQEEGAVFKVAFKQIKKKKNILLKSLNPSFEPYEMPVLEIREAWKFVNYFSSELPESAFSVAETLRERITYFNKFLENNSFPKEAGKEVATKTE